MHKTNGIMENGVWQRQLQREKGGGCYGRHIEQVRRRTQSVRKWRGGGPGRGARDRAEPAAHINCENNCKCHGYVYMRCKLQRKLKRRIACMGQLFRQAVKEGGEVEGRGARCN